VKEFRVNGTIAKGTTLLEASAGTGKTFSIAHLVTRLVTEMDIGIGKILVVTFTNAATAELRDRIRNRLRDADAALAGAEPDDDVLTTFVAAAEATGDTDAYRRRLRLALEGYDEAMIATIHGFCQRMLRENAFESGADFDAELVTDVDAILDDILRDFWSNETYALPEQLVRYLGETATFDQLGKIARSCGNADLSVVPPPPATTDVDDSRWLASCEAVRLAWNEDRDGACAAITRAITADKPVDKHLDGRTYQIKRTEKYAADIDRWLDGIQRPDKDLSKSKTRLYFSKGQLQHKTKAGKTTPTHAVFDAIQKNIDEGERLAESCAGWVLAMRHRLVAYTRQELVARAGRLHVQSYDDLLRLVREATSDGPETALAQRIRDRFEVALIDEFQDTDPVQWGIFEQVFHAAGARMHLIGDPKQAIYSFRGADLATYLEARESARTKARLDTNFRSDPALIEAVGALFQARLPFADAAIDCPPVKAKHDRPRLLVNGAPQPPLHFRFVERSPEIGNGKFINKTWPGLATCVATEIAQFLNDGHEIVSDDDTTSKVSPRDCAVLVRKHHQARDIQIALRAVGVPSVLHGAASVFASEEAGELETILRAIANPGYGAAVRAALATEIMGFGAGAIAEFQSTDDGDWEEQIERFRGWREIWRDHGFVQMFRTVMNDCRVAERLLRYTDGERRMTNLLHLTELAHTQSVDERLGPVALLAWLGHQRVEPDSDGESDQLRLETDDDAVEIVTVHSCKGLEYGVTWCPYLWTGDLWVSEKEPFLFHDENGRNLNIAPTKGGLGWDAAIRERRQEELRLLYVALTRAKYRCTVYCGAFKSFQTSPLAYLLHQPDEGEPAGLLAAVAERAVGLDDNALYADIVGLAEASGATIRVDRVDTNARAIPYRGRAKSDEPLAALTFDRRVNIDSSWRWSSFSAIIRPAEDDIGARGGRAEDVEAGTDAATPPITSAAGTAALDASDRIPIPLAEFRGGLNAGNFFHKVMEVHDFQANQDELADHVGEQMERYGIDAAVSGDRVAEALSQAMHTPLRAGAEAFRLCDVSRTNCFRELAFTYPVGGGLGASADAAGLTKQALYDVLLPHLREELPGKYVERLRQLGFGTLRGFLTGSIDLAIRDVLHGDELWYVADYKSNNLGPLRGDYRPTRLLDEMDRHHYFLQAQIYTVALHRYLEWRLPEYDYDKNFGGVLYLFLRGMSPDTGPHYGVYFDRPPRAQVEALSGLMTGDEGTA